MTKEPKTFDKNSKKNTRIKCPNCDENNMVWDKKEQLWQCLSCGYRMEE